MNNHVPDVEKLFAERLKMDTSEKDVHARVTSYFISFDKLVDDNGLASWVGRAEVTDSAGQQRMKTRYKLLMANLAPAMLRVDIQRLAEVTHRHVKQDDVALYELIVTKASLQQHYHQMQQEVKKAAPEKPKSTAKKSDGGGSEPTAATPTEARKNTVDVRINTAAGPVKLRDVPCLVLDGDEDEFLLGRKPMQDIGIDIERRFEQLADGGRVSEGDGDDVTSSDAELEFQVDMAEIHVHLERMLDAAKCAGFAPALLGKLRTLVYKYADVWRVRIGADPPTNVEPLKVRLQPDAQPYRSGTRKYPEPKRKFLRDFVQELERNGLVRRNNTGRWACPALPVVKPHSEDFRCTIDYRPVNRVIIALAGATPNMLSVIQSVKGAYGFGLFDLFKGFWQLPLDVASQELFSFVTEDGVFTPTRVPQDDLLLFARTAEHYLANLEQFFQVLRTRRLKLNAKKCVLFATKMTWCGKVVDGEGIQHSPERLKADSLVDYARTIQPLQAKLEQVMARRGRRKSQLTGVDLEWPGDDAAAFKAAMDLIATSNKQHFVDQEVDVCLFTDASNTGWSIVVSQVLQWDDAVSVTEQAHQLLVYPEAEACEERGARDPDEWWAGVDFSVKDFCVRAHDVNVSAAWMQVPLGTDLSDTTASAKRVTTRSSRDVSVLRPLQHDDFVWPTDDSSRSVQRSYRAVAPAEEDADGLVRVEGKLWIPSEARELMQRLFVIAWWRCDGSCAGSALVKGGKLVQRQWGPTSTATTRNECLHMDYLSLGESYGSARYVLVLKDELTHYCSVMAELAERLKAVHKFVPVYTPWINGTVERVNRDILQVLRVILMEMNLDTRNWPYLLPLVQANLNHSAVASLADRAPVELFTGLPAPSMLDVVVVPVDGDTRLETFDSAAVAPHLDTLREHLATMHLEVTDRKERRRVYELARSKEQICNFEVGDFVLWSRVDTRMRGHKLLVRWVGPFRVAQALSHSFIVSHLLTGDEFEVHGSRPQALL
ncbi:hypothetical protein PHPALM_30355 [Phytophthora palmivora]|uniref:Integrase catalytic domain-containing protein n=1 Tax=Phytophthora palmivora TaxID=4796 RepID=A0A2P4X5B1_9STRA|nr:hypothetical protein PHPALM_30355 [Phytophthora palmivora]